MSQHITIVLLKEVKSDLLSGECTIAQFLGKEHVLEALKKIAEGDCTGKWFDLVGDEWNLEAQLNQQLAAMDLPITLEIFADDKIHLTGKNGCGKSTLLRTLLGNLALSQGELHVNTPLYYLDQHFGVISHDRDFAAESGVSRQYNLS